MKKLVVKVGQHPKFRKQLQKAPNHVRRAFQKRITLFLSDQYHPFLHNHLLTGDYQGFRSINITGNWRALYKEVVLDEDHIIIEFHLFGTHSQLYR
jgi:addiction module RelE/StbE family toxin